MSMIPMFLKELEAEAATTRKFLARVPNDKFDWKPHPKSMDIRNLATHIAELPDWISMVLTTDELDFAKAPYNPTVLNSSKELLDTFEKSLAKAKEQLNATKESELDKKWTLRNGDAIYGVHFKSENIRHALSQIIHHRAQLGVNFRLLDVPVPASYGPSADENVFEYESPLA
ncbi:MAG: hypothetical protein K0S33_3911 [Bacteroidetes bacterium]|nr:hypothetical protein [Bacteroidota bacterium]